jgi:hypothetical protein
VLSFSKQGKGFPQTYYYNIIGESMRYGQMVFNLCFAPCSAGPAPPAAAKYVPIGRNPPSEIRDTPPLLNNHPIINFMLITREAAVFSKSIDSSDHVANGGRKDAQYLADALIAEIRSVGPENVVQIIMDGANRSVFPIIEKEFPHITCTWCAAHVLDLLMEDIAKMEFFSSLWEQGKSVVKWIRGHQHFRAKMAKMSKKVLLLPGIHSFDLNLNMMILTCISQVTHDSDLLSSCFAECWRSKMSLLNW